MRLAMGAVFYQAIEQDGRHQTNHDATTQIVKEWPMLCVYRVFEEWLVLVGSKKSDWNLN